MHCFHCVFQVAVVTRRYSTYYFPHARSVPCLWVLFYLIPPEGVRSPVKQIKSQVKQKLPKTFSQPPCCRNGCVPIGSKGIIQIRCASLAASTCQVMVVSARPRTRHGRNQVELSSLTRETGKSASTFTI